MLQTALDIGRVGFPFLISLCVLAFFAGLLVALVLTVILITDKEKGNKKKRIWIIVGCAVGPIAVMLVLVILWGLLNVLGGLFAVPR